VGRIHEGVAIKARTIERGQYRCGREAVSPSSPLPVEMMILGWTERRSKSNGKSWLGDGIHSHLSDDETVAKMGHPFDLGWLRENRQQQRQRRNAGILRCAQNDERAG
jgi:hypothetical protein